MTSNIRKKEKGKRKKWKTRKKAKGKRQKWKKRKTERGGNPQESGPRRRTGKGFG
jgi:hypothetical protein